MFEGEKPDTESEDDDFDAMAFSFVSHGTNWAQAQQTPTEQITQTINALCRSIVAPDTALDLWEKSDSPSETS